MSILPVGMEVRAYGWREAAVDGRTQLVGYAKICPDKVASAAGKRVFSLNPSNATSRMLDLLFSGFLSCLLRTWNSTLPVFSPKLRCPSSL